MEHSGKGVWEEVDQGQAERPVGKVRRHLHWWVAVGLGVGVLGGFLAQNLLFEHVEASPVSPSSSETGDARSEREPSLAELHQELQREQLADPAPALVTPLPAPVDKGKSRAMADVQQLAHMEEDKKLALIASSRMLAINRTMTGTFEQTGPDSVPTDHSEPVLPAGISAIPAGLTAGSKAPPPTATPASGKAHDPAPATPLLPILPASPCLVMEGTLIPAVLLTQVNSDLPGMLTAQVTEDVYDSVHGDYLAIPKGSRLIGEYRSHIVAGQDRIMAMFHRLILPGGESFSLDQMQAADSEGQMGMKDQVDNRFWTRFGGQFMTAGLARIVSPPEGGVMVLGGMGNTLATDAAGQILVNAASVGFAQNAVVGPVIMIRKGYPFVITVNRDMDFSSLIPETLR